MSDYPKFHKIPRLYNETLAITEKIDGTNGLIYIYPLNENVPYQNVPWIGIDVDGYSIAAGSRNKWLTTEDDNHGFAKWVDEHQEALISLGKGHHFGEWAGPGINGNRHRLEEKTFFLFNWRKWVEDELSAHLDIVSLPDRLSDINIDVVPILDIDVPYNFLGSSPIAFTRYLEEKGSRVGNNTGDAEGVVVESNLTGQVWKYFCGGIEKNATRKGS